MIAAVEQGNTDVGLDGHFLQRPVLWKLPPDICGKHAKFTADDAFTRRPRQIVFDILGRPPVSRTGHGPDPVAPLLTDGHVGNIQRDRQIADQCLEEILANRSGNAVRNGLENSI